MRDDSESRASVRIERDSVTVEGREDFVERLVEKLGLESLVDQIDFSVSGRKPAEVHPNESNESGETGERLLPAPSTDSDVFESFDEVYINNGEGFNIIADVEENTIAKTARNYILLHLYGAYLCDELEVSDDDLRALCISHACYDPGNFAQHVKGLGSKVIRLGTPRSYRLKLTAPGIRAAKQFALDTQKKAADH